mmetsp:Transcript_20372/g.51943  ORF Transcript_20372/g.51943 Transcript_20372/m.51943 type:complete len:357 (+) Transcript_20372:769-1839(+)
MPLLLTLRHCSLQFLRALHRELGNAIHVHDAVSHVTLHVETLLLLRRTILPSLPRIPRVWGQEVQDVLLVHLDHVRFDFEGLALLRLPVDDVEDLVDRTRREPRLGAAAIHGVRLPGTSLAVGKDRDVIAIDCTLHQLPAVGEDILLRAAGIEDRVELERLRLVAALQPRRKGVSTLQHLNVPSLRFPLDHRSEAAEHADRALHVQDLVVELLPLLLLIRELLLQPLQLHVQLVEFWLHLCADGLGCLARLLVSLRLALRLEQLLLLSKLGVLQLLLQLEGVRHTLALSLLEVRLQLHATVLGLILRATKGGGLVLLLRHLLVEGLSVSLASRRDILQPLNFCVKRAQDVELALAQ